MAKKVNAYSAIIEKIFFDRYDSLESEVKFLRSDIENAAKTLKVKVPKNLGDVLYSFRSRADFPESIIGTQPEGKDWVILSTGKGEYSFRLFKNVPDLPSDGLPTIEIPDATPELIRAYALGDEQALLAIVRYNRLVEIFLSITAYSLQNHLRTSVSGIGQIEIDELYAGIDKFGCHYIIPIQAKRGKDQISIVQTIQDVGFVEEKFPGLRCRAVGVQFISEHTIALFELKLLEDEIVVVDEKHYSLVPQEKLDKSRVTDYQE